MKKILVLVFLLMAKFAIAQIPEQVKNSYVDDYAHVLTPAQVAVLNQNILNIDKKYQVELAVVLLDTLPKNINIGELSILIGRKWEIGKDRNGLVYIALIKQTWHHLDVVNGVTAESVFGNKKCGELLSSMRPYFAAKNYNSGLLLLVNQIDATLAPYVQQGIQQRPMWAIMGVSAVIGVVILVITGLIVLGIFLFVKSRNKKKSANVKLV